MVFVDIDFQLTQGFSSAFRAQGPSYSPLSQSDVWLAESHPGLSGVVRHKKHRTIVIFVDELSVGDVLIYHLGQGAQRDDKPATKIVHVQDAVRAWQFAQVVEEELSLDEIARVFFVKWRPGALRAAIEAHDACYRALPNDRALSLTGSDFEKESVSRFHLATGISSIAHTLLANGALSAIASGQGKAVALDLPFCTEGFVREAIRG